MNALKCSHLVRSIRVMQAPVMCHCHAIGIHSYTTQVSPNLSSNLQLPSASFSTFNHRGIEPSKRCFSRFVDGDVPPDIRQEPPWRVLFFGTCDFSLPHLKALHENRDHGEKTVVESLEVVVPKYSSVVKSYAREHGLKIHHWPIPTMDSFDVGVLVSFGQLIPRRVIQMLPYGILNVHPSILPRWRGASPIVHTILNGDTETAISIMEIKPKHFDIGPLLLQNKYPVPDNITAPQLQDYLSNYGRDLILQTLADLPTLERLEHDQSGEGVTYSHKILPINAFINWEKQTVGEIDRQFRSLSQIQPLRTEFNGKVVKLLDMVSLDDMEKDENIQVRISMALNRQPSFIKPGYPIVSKFAGALCVKCLDGWVAFKNVVIRKPMTAQAFFNGYLKREENSGVCFTSRDNELEKYIFDVKVPQETDPKSPLTNKRVAM